VLAPLVCLNVARAVALCIGEGLAVHCCCRRLRVWCCVTFQLLAGGCTHSQVTAPGHAVDVQPCCGSLNPIMRCLLVQPTQSSTTT
jgi:hypothetical protein